MAYTRKEKQDVVAVIQTSDTNQVRITKVSNEDGELECVDIRNWYITEEDEDEFDNYKPTKKGVRIAEEYFEEFAAALKDAGVLK